MTRKKDSKLFCTSEQETFRMWSPVWHHCRDWCCRWCGGQEHRQLQGPMWPSECYDWPWEIANWEEKAMGLKQTDRREKEKREWAKDRGRGLHFHVIPAGRNSIWFSKGRYFWVGGGNQFSVSCTGGNSHLIHFCKLFISTNCFKMIQWFFYVNHQKVQQKSSLQKSVQHLCP